MARRWSTIGGYFCAVLAVFVFWWMQQRGLLADTPFPLLVGLLALASALDLCGRLLQRRHPSAVGITRGRLTASAVTTALVLYATGWGSVLIIGFAVGTAQILGESKKADWRWAYGANVLAVVAGEIAVARGVAPSLIEPQLANAVAFVGVICLLVVTWILGEALRSAEDSRQIALDREERLVALATTDSLTGLPNRTLCHDRLRQALRRLDREQGFVAAMIVDLDGFKHVNDSLGHPIGDALLLAAADRFRSILRGFDTIARVGGDEFAVIIDHVATREEAERVAERVIDGLSTPLELLGRTVAIGASVGIALADQTDIEPEALLGQADAAMYCAKRAGKGCHRVFEESMQIAAFERLNLEQELRAAIANDEIVVHFQPVIETSSGLVTCFEALARWPHPTRGMVGPDTFIPIAEDTGLIFELGRVVLLESCRMAKRWESDVLGLPVAVSVNVSRDQLSSAEFVAMVGSTLEICGLEPSSLVLEVTESVLSRDAAGTSATLDELRRLGVRVAIDDFGTGYSSFAALEDLSVDILKIDKRFVDILVRDAEGHGLVKAIMQLAQTLGLETVAEGVEFESQGRALIELGCTHMQGFLFAPAIAGEATLEFLAESGSGSLLVDRAAVSATPAWLD